MFFVSAKLLQEARSYWDNGKENGNSYDIVGYIYIGGYRLRCQPLRAIYRPNPG